MSKRACISPENEVLPLENTSSTQPAEELTAQMSRLHIFDVMNALPLEQKMSMMRDSEKGCSCSCKVMRDLIEENRKNMILSQLEDVTLTETMCKIIEGNMEKHDEITDKALQKLCMLLLKVAPGWDYLDFLEGYKLKARYESLYLEESKKGAQEIAMKVLDLHVGVRGMASPSIVEKACQIYSYICRSYEVRDKVGERGEVRRLCHIIERAKDGEQSNLLKEALRALHSLTLERTNLADVFGSQRAAEVVLAVMVKYHRAGGEGAIKNWEVLYDGSCVMSSVCMCLCNFKEVEKFHEFFFDNKAVEMILDAMETYADFEPLQRDACRALHDFSSPMYSTVELSLKCRSVVEADSRAAAMVCKAWEQFRDNPETAKAVEKVKRLLSC